MNTLDYGIFESFDCLDLAIINNDLNNDVDFVPKFLPDYNIDSQIDQNNCIEDSPEQILNQNFVDLNQILDSSNDSINGNIYLDQIFSSSSKTSPSSDSTENYFPNFDTSVIENYDFTKTPSGPIKFILKEANMDDMKICTEVILNFDNSKNLIDDTVDEIQNVTVHAFNDTRIDLSDINEISEDNDSDSDSNQTGETVLTEEEKTVYIKEGYKIPTRTPLTKSEEKILKLVRRKIRNKKSAHISRERKKKYVDGLEKRVDLCTKENEQLQTEVKTLKTRNSELMKELQKMQSLIANLVTKNRKSSTAVLFVSFFITFCIFPNMNFGDNIEPNSLTYETFRPVSGNLVSLDTQNSPVEINKTDRYEYIWDFYKSRYDI